MLTKIAYIAHYALTMLTCRCHWVKRAICSCILAEKFSTSRNLAVNFCSRQNSANPNICRIFGSAGFIFLNWAMKSSCRPTRISPLSYRTQRRSKRSNLLGRLRRMPAGFQSRLRRRCSRTETRTSQTVLEVESSCQPGQ